MLWSHGLHANVLEKMTAQMGVAITFAPTAHPRLGLLPSSQSAYYEQSRLSDELTRLDGVKKHAKPRLIAVVVLITYHTAW